MRRFFAELDGVAPGSLVTLPKDEAAHAARTLRLRAGDRVGLIDGLGSSFAAVLVEAGERVSAEIVESLPPNEPRLRTTLYQGLPKLDKLERIIQQSTEIGVDRIVPVLFERCDAKIFSKERAARGNRIARESSKQCGRAVCPPVEPMISFDECAARVSLEENAYLFWERAVEPFAEQFAKRPPGLRRASIIIGPEGGVSDAEAERLVRAGAIPVSLGSRILRAETAPVAALALMLGLYGDMG